MLSPQEIYPPEYRFISRKYYIPDNTLKHVYPTRLFDILISLAVLICFAPFLLLIAVLIKATSKGPVVFAQKRVGRNGIDFVFYKFRTMYVNNNDKNFLTIGLKDSRITPIGNFLRRTKLDELPQLVNVLKNEMSIVGPRPEVRKFVNLYTPAQKLVLQQKPGITDYASIEFVNESELLAKQRDPEAYYIKKIMPRKIMLNSKYAHNKTLRNYFAIIFKTFFCVIG